MTTEGYTALILYQAMSKYAFSSELPEDEEFRKQATAFAGLNEDASEAELHEKLSAEYSSYATMAEISVLKARENIWRFPAWQSVEVRRKFPLFEAIIALNACPEALPEKLRVALLALLETDDEAMKLIRGNADVKAKFDELSSLWEAYGNEPEVPPDFGAEQLLRYIPEIVLASYSKNAYEAAIQALQSKYADEIKQANEECKKLEEKGATEAENVKYITDNLPTFRQLAVDKIHVWKEINLVPTLAKVKFLTGQKMSDSEATRLLEEVQAVKHGSKTLFGKKYRADIAQRVYTDRVKSRLAERAETAKKPKPGKSALPTRETQEKAKPGKPGLPTRETQEKSLLKQEKSKPAEQLSPTPEMPGVSLVTIILAVAAFIVGTNFLGVAVGVAAALGILIFSAARQRNN